MSNKIIYIALFCLVSFLNIKAQNCSFDLMTDSNRPQLISLGKGDVCYKDDPDNELFIGVPYYYNNLKNSNVILNSGANLTYRGPGILMSPNVTIKEGAQLHVLYDKNIPVGNEPIGYTMERLINGIGRGDTIFAYRGNKEGQGVFMANGIQFGRAEMYKDVWKISPYYHVESGTGVYDFLGFYKSSSKNSNNIYYRKFVELHYNSNLSIDSYHLYKLSIGGNVLANRYLTASDKRLKKDIKQLSDCSNIISKLNSKSYYKNTTKDKKNQIEFGLIAQEVENVIPEIVNKVEGDEGVYSIDYQSLLPLIVETMKEQQILINKNQRKIEQIKSML